MPDVLFATVYLRLKTAAGSRRLTLFFLKESMATLTFARLFQHVEVLFFFSLIAEELFFPKLLRTVPAGLFPL